MPTGIRIEPRPGLTEAERAQVEHLRITCNEADGLDLKLVYETAAAEEAGAATCALALAGDEVVGYVSLDTGSSVEICGMVAPSHRRRGVGRGLLAAARREVTRRGGTESLLIAEEGSAGAQAFVRAIGWKPQSREYRMELDLASWAPSAPVSVELQRADSSQAETYTEVAAAAFGEDPAELLERARRFLDDPNERSYIVRLTGEAIGVGRVTAEMVGTGRLIGLGDRAGIYGFAVVPGWRGRGIGGQMLDAMLVEALRAGYRRALLEVEPDNVAAVRLYRSRGFVGARTYGYYAPNKG